MCNSTSDRRKKNYSVLLVNFLFAPVLVYTKIVLQKNAIEIKYTVWIHPEKANAVNWSQVPLRWFQWFPVHAYITETAHVLFTFLFLCTLALSKGLRASVFQTFFS